MTLGQSIKNARNKKGITQAELAAKIGVYQATLSYWETDRNCPSLLFAICIADVLEMTLDELVGRTVKK